LRKAGLAHVIIMAFDGFAIHRHLHPRENPIDNVTIDAVAGMLTGDSPHAASLPVAGDSAAAKARKANGGTKRSSDNAEPAHSLK
jgi:hypothetical protein